MRISNLRLENRYSDVALVADVESKKFGKTTIWVSASKEYESWLCIDRYDGFLLALLYPAMAYGENIEVDGIVSKRLLRNIMRHVQEILVAYNHRLNKVKIEVKGTSSEVIKTAKHIGTGFTGGVDSFSTIYENYVLENDAEYKIDTLVFLNVGSHGHFWQDEAYQKTMFQNRYEFLKSYPNVINLPFIQVNSNIHSYYSEWNFSRFHILATLSAILTVQQKIKKYYFASAVGGYDVWIDKAKEYRDTSANSYNTDIAVFTEAYLLPLLSTETIELVSDGLQYTRVEKTIGITDYPLSKQFLNVCLESEPQKKNCGQCYKCLRVLMTLQVVDKLDEYAEVFDIEKYSEKRFYHWCVAVSSANHNLFQKEITNFAKENGYRVPSLLVATIVSLIAKLYGVFPKALQRKLKKIVLSKQR